MLHGGQRARTAFHDMQRELHSFETLQARWLEGELDLASNLLCVVSIVLATSSSLVHDITI